MMIICLLQCIPGHILFSRSGTQGPSHITEVWKSAHNSSGLHYSLQDLGKNFLVTFSHPNCSGSNLSESQSEKVTLCKCELSVIPILFVFLFMYLIIYLSVLLTSNILTFLESRYARTIIETLLTHLFMSMLALG